MTDIKEHLNNYFVWCAFTPDIKFRGFSAKNKFSGPNNPDLPCKPGIFAGLGWKLGELLLKRLFFGWKFLTFGIRPEITQSRRLFRRSLNLALALLAALCHRRNRAID